MKNAVIVALVCVNLLILVALVVGTGSVPQAKAQGFVGQDYMVIAAKIDKTEDVIFVTDLAKSRMLAFQFDQRKKQLVPYRGSRLLRDFGRQAQAKN